MKQEWQTHKKAGSMASYFGSTLSEILKEPQNKDNGYNKLKSIHSSGNTNGLLFFMLSFLRSSKLFAAERDLRDEVEEVLYLIIEKDKNAIMAVLDSRAIINIPSVFDKKINCLSDSSTGFCI